MSRDSQDVGIRVFCKRCRKSRGADHVEIFHKRDDVWTPDSRRTRITNLKGTRTSSLFDPEYGGDRWTPTPLGGRVQLKCQRCGHTVPIRDETLQVVMTALAAGSIHAITLGDLERLVATHNRR